jgi:hypothetical protein
MTTKTKGLFGRGILKQWLIILRNTKRLDTEYPQTFMITFGQTIRRILVDKGTIEDLEKSAFDAGFAVACNKISERINNEIKAQHEEKEITTDPEERANIFLFIAGLGMADRIIKWVQYEEAH